MVDYYCVKCGRREPADKAGPLCPCGELWRVEYKAPAYDESLIDKNEWSMFRYRSFMPLEGDGWKSVSMGEGMTPIVRLDENVSLKLDFMMPTLSYKDRGAAMLAWLAKGAGISSAVQDSSGNAGNSVAAYFGRAGIDCDIYVPEGTSPKKISMIKSHGANVHIIPGGRDRTADVCRKRALSGEYYASHVFNPMFYQGTKTFIYEVYEQLGRMPENLILPAGNGTLVLGVFYALKEMGIKPPKIHIVQSENCAPLYDAWKNGSEPLCLSPLPTLAEGIAIGKPARAEEILGLAREFDARFITAPESRINEARDILAKHGIFCEHTSACLYAAYLEDPMPDTLIPMTGAGLKSEK